MLRCAAALGLLAFVAAALLEGQCRAASGGEKSFRLPETDLRQQVIWGAACDGPDGGGLAFGGEDQKAEDGCSHTRVKEGGAWKDIRGQLQSANPLQSFHDRAWAIRTALKNAAARARAIYFDGLPPDEEERVVKADVAPRRQKVAKDIETLMAELEAVKGLGEYEAGQVRCALGLLRSACARQRPPAGGPAESLAAATKAMSAAVIDLEGAAEALDAEPPPRALSSIVYDAESRLYVLFGGDHLDYLTNDTWVFDPAARAWRQRHAPSAPPPRAGHRLQAAGDGRVVLSGGYTYTSSTDYCGGQYRNIGDGDWTYDVAANVWTGAGQAVPADARVYRTGPFHPDFFMEGPSPDAAEVAARLKRLPLNEWVPMNPPRIPRLDRCWGTAVLDADRDLILVWGGGHSAHGGTDVLHYHLASNRWELCYPVEFPLGQLYSNTSYPEGVNFNRRPWVTGHTYQNYGYDAVLRKMLFAGEHRYFYIYEPEVGDWAGRAPKPPGMVYEGCFYTLTLCGTPHGLVCWTHEGRIFRFDAAAKAWTELKASGKLPGASVDYSTVVYDSKRDRLIFFRTDYGKKYDGQVHALDIKGMATATVGPRNMGAAGAAALAIDRACYDPASDLVLVAAILAPGADGLQRTAAYDCAANRWVSLKIRYAVGGDRKPLTPRGPGHSCGVMYDARRRLIWGVDTYHCQVYALRFDAASADLAELK
jgi:hypothetical protein